MQDAKMFCEKIDEMRSEIKKRIKGYEKEIDLSLVAMATSGHVLYTGVPGIAKTLLARTIAEASGCTSKRIQLTPDLIPSDIRGAEIWNPDRREFEVRKGPIFANIVVADEINRAIPRTQSAFLDAMQEKTVTIGSNTLALPDPFVVFATRNPIEQEATFPLPEAQLDRFLFEIVFPYPDEDDEIKIAKMGNSNPADIESVWTPKDLIALENFASQNVHMEHSIYEYIVKFVRTTRAYDPDMIVLGASPRSSQKWAAACKAYALVVRNETSVIPDDVDYIAKYILSHRLIMNPMHWEGKESDWEQLIKDIGKKAREKHVTP